MPTRPRFPRRSGARGQSATSQFSLLPNTNPSSNFAKVTQRLPVKISRSSRPTALSCPGMMVESRLKSADEDLEDYIARLPPNEGFTQGFHAWGRNYRWFALLTIVAGNVAAMLAGTIINVAIPDIMGAFGISQADAQWLSTANLAAATVAMLASSWMVRVLGLRETVNISMFLLLAGSLLGGLPRTIHDRLASQASRQGC
jgi:hypothetical protein